MNINVLIAEEKYNKLIAALQAMDRIVVAFGLLHETPGDEVGHVWSDGDGGVEGAAHASFAPSASASGEALEDLGLVESEDWNCWKPVTYRVAQDDEQVAHQVSALVCGSEEASVTSASVRLTIEDDDADRDEEDVSGG